MGLDTVELVMEIEDHFKIAIPDEDAERIQTVGELFNYVCARRPDLAPRAGGRCASQHAFYEVRQRLIAVVRCDRRDIRPKARLGDIIRSEKRRAVWEELGNRLGFKPAALLPSPMMSIGIIALGMAAGVWAATSPEQPSLLGILFLPLIASLAVYWFLKPWAVWLLGRGPSIGDLSMQWLLHHRSHLGPANPADEESIWEDIVTIVSEQAGISRGEISKNTHILNDLNFG